MKRHRKIIEALEHRANYWAKHSRQSPTPDAVAMAEAWAEAVRLARIVTSQALDGCDE